MYYYFSSDRPKLFQLRKIGKGERMIRVLHITGSMNRGGIETFIMNIYRNMDREKVQFDFLLWTDKKCDYTDEILRLGGKIYNISPRRKGIINNIKELINFFSKHKEYRIVHQHVNSLSYITPLKIAKKNNVPIRIIHGHSIQVGGHPLNQYLHRFNKLSIRKIATDFFACSELAAKWLYPTKQYLAGDYKIIKNAIDIDSFTYSETVRNKIRNELNIQDKLVIGHIGRFSYQKNHDFIVDIFKEIYLRNPDSLLLLIGNGELMDKIKNKVKSLGLDNNVIFTGVRSDISELLQAMDIFLFPSHYEGLGIVLIEAQAAGLKCFTSLGVVPNEVNVTGQVEFIDLNKSSKEWAELILKSSNYTRYRHGSKIKAAGYDIKLVAKEMEKWYLEKYKCH